MSDHGHYGDLALSHRFQYAPGMDASEAARIKARENRLRRMADRQGLRLVKSSRRDPFALGYGTFRIDTKDGQTLIGDRETYGLDPDAVEQWLTTRREDR